MIGVFVILITHLVNQTNFFRWRLSIGDYKRPQRKWSGSRDYHLVCNINSVYDCIIREYCCTIAKFILAVYILIILSLHTVLLSNHISKTNTIYVYYRQLQNVQLCIENLCRNIHNLHSLFHCIVQQLTFYP